jgi:hypothetical protein
MGWAKGIGLGADIRGMNTLFSNLPSRGLARVRTSIALATLLIVGLGGCSAGVKIGASNPDSVPPAKPVASSGLFAFDASIPWVKAGASFNPPVPSLNWFKPSVEVVNPGNPGKSKTQPENARQNARTPVATPQLVNPCSLTQKPDERVPPDVEAIGYASINAQHADDLSQRRLLAARASRLDAYRNLVEQIYGVQFSSDSAMLDARLGEDSFHTRVEGSMCGATVVSIEPLGDDLYQTRLRLPGVVAAGLRAHGNTTSL